MTDHVDALTDYAAVDTLNICSPKQEVLPYNCTEHGISSTVWGWQSVKLWPIFLGAINWDSEFSKLAAVGARECGMQGANTWSSHNCYSHSGSVITLTPSDSIYKLIQSCAHKLRWRSMVIIGMSSIFIPLIRVLPNRAKTGRRS
jgi:hypothetical protein